MRDLEDELYTVNETGLDVWRLLDGRALNEVVEALQAEYDAPARRSTAMSADCSRSC